MVDVATGWSERACLRARTGRPDNGNEFLNDHLVRYWKEAAQGLRLMRSRPFHKNDNRFVEQKNSTLVRAYLGQERLEGRLQCEKLNELYEVMWRYYNLFQPVMRLLEKEPALKKDGTYRVKHRHDTAKTPFERLWATDAISQEAKEQLAALRERTNPRQLRKEIYRLLDELLSLGEQRPTPNRNFNLIDPDTERLPVQRQSKKGAMVPVTLSIE